MRSKSPRGIFLTALFTCALWFSTCAAAGDGELSRIVVFGDSLTDPGNAFVLTHQVFVPPYQLIPDFPYARGGHHFSNGKTWVEQLARGLDMADSTCPALAARGRCSNYAVGGARARPGTPFDLSSQVAMFRSDFAGFAKAEAFYVVHIGGNDLRDALEALASDPTGATSIADINGALRSIAANIVTLTSAGAREFLVVNAPNVALAPAIRLQGPQVQAAAHALSVAFNDALASVLAGLEASLTRNARIRAATYSGMASIRREPVTRFSRAGCARSWGCFPSTTEADFTARRGCRRCSCRWRRAPSCST